MIQINESEAFRAIRALEKSTDTEDQHFVVQLLRRMGNHVEADAREIEARTADFRRTVIAAVPVISGIKAFDRELKCRGFQFEVGKTYTIAGDVVACGSGFHAIPDNQHPLSVLEYYPPSSRFCEVEQGGKSVASGNKLASASITIKAEFQLHDLIARAVRWVFDRAKPEGECATGDYGAASATGYSGAASATGDYGAASATGYSGAASATGYYGAASASGARGVASATGYNGAASASGARGVASATGWRGVASATGERGAASATGDYGAASASGARGVASATGWRGAAIAGAKYAHASATGPHGAVGAMHDDATLFAREFSDDGDTLLSIACGRAGHDGIKAGAWYRCIGGKLVEVFDVG